MFIVCLRVQGLVFRIVISSHYNGVLGALNPKPSTFLRALEIPAGWVENAAFEVTVL